MPLGMELGLSPGDLVLDGDPAAPPPKFSAYVYYSYCDFVTTLHNTQLLLVCSSSSFSILCILFLEKRLIVLSLYAIHSCTALRWHSAAS